MALSLDDYILQGTGGPSVNDGLFSWYGTNGGTGNSLQDRAMSFLISKGYTTGTLQDRWFAYLGSLGYTQNSLQDRFYAFWAAGGIISGFSPSELFQAGEVGVWYDPSDFSTLYQDTAGSTPVTAVEQPVGLMLDKSQGLVLGSELVDTANTAAAWTAYGTNTAQQDGDYVKVTYVDDGRGAYIFLSAAQGLSTNLTIGRSYQLTATVKVSSGASVTIKQTTSTGGVFATITSSTDTPIQTIFAATSATNHFLAFDSMNAGEIAYIKNISVKELPGNHAVAANNSTARPVLRSRYNLLTYSEQFDNAAWTKTGATITANATTAPDGTTTADLITEDNTLGRHFTYYAPGGAETSVVPSRPYKFSVYVKANGRQYAQVAFVPQGTESASALFDLVNLQVTDTRQTTTVTYIDASITDAGNGWRRLSLTASTTESTTFFNVGLSDVSTFAAGTLAFQMMSYTGDGTSGVYLWGAQLVANSVFPANTYQRIAAATDYDTDATKFPPYLAFTTDDAMSTASIDFSGTDEMSVFAGLTKQSDAATGTLCELSINIASYAGSFFINAPASASSNYSMRAGGSIRPTAAVLTPFAAPITNVLTMGADISDDTVAGRVNGALVATASGDQGTGNFGNWPLYIGARAGSSVFFNGSLYSLIVRGKTSTVDEIHSTENYVAGKTGLGTYTWAFEYLVDNSGNQITTDSGDSIFVNETLTITPP